MVSEPQGVVRPTVLMLTNDRRIDRRIILQADSLEEDGWQVTILGMPLDAPQMIEIVPVGAMVVVVALRIFIPL